MRLIKIAIVFGVLAIALPVTGQAQTDNFGIMDTLYADLERIDDLTWSITISLTNDEIIEGLSVPFKMTAGMNRIVADSAIYTGGRVDSFALKVFRPDTVIQCVTLGMVANLGPSKNSLPPGSGRLVTIFVSSLEGKPIDSLMIDSTTTNPANSLMLVAATANWGDVRLDTIKVEKRQELNIFPVWVVRQPEK